VCRANMVSHVRFYRSVVTRKNALYFIFIFFIKQVFICFAVYDNKNMTYAYFKTVVYKNFSKRIGEGCAPQSPYPCSSNKISRKRIHDLKQILDA